MATFQTELFRLVAADGLAAIGLDYERCDDGTFVHRGVRPGRDWHAHGWLATSPKTLVNGQVTSIRLRKRRWRLRGTNQTRHSRPADDLGRRYCALVVALSLFGWLDAALGLHRHAPLLDSLTDRPDRRTLQRWLACALPRALDVQQAIRHALLDRMEPRPVEALFPSGLPPPPASRRRWRDPPAVDQLHRGLAMLFGAAIALKKPGSSLLAEARRKAGTRPRRDD